MSCKIKAQDISKHQFSGFFFFKEKYKY